MEQFLQQELLLLGLDNKFHHQEDLDNLKIHKYRIHYCNIQFVHLCLENTTDGETVDTHDDHWHNICNLKPFNINCVTIVGRGFITLIFHRRMSCNGHSTFDIVIFLQENKFYNFCIDVS